MGGKIPCSSMFVLGSYELFGIIGRGGQSVCDKGGGQLLALADGNPSREGQWPPLTGLRDRKLTHSQRFRAGLISFALRAGRRPLLTQSFTFLNSTCQPALEE